MYLKHTLIVVTLFAATMTACQPRQKTEIENSGTPVHIINVDISSHTPLSNIGKSRIKTIVLDDENAQSFPALIFNGEVSSDTLYAIDAYKSPGLYAYNLNTGLQLYAYTETGNGNGEFMTLSDLNVESKAVSAYDRINNRLMKFDKQGQFLSYDRMPQDATEVIRDGNGNLWIEYSNNDNTGVKLSYIACGDSVEQTIYPTPDHLKGITVIPQRSFHKMPDGHISYYPWLEDTVYDLYDGNMSPKFHLNLNGLLPKQEELKSWADNGDWAFKLRTMKLHQLSYSENTDWVILFLRVSDEGYLHIHHKTTGKERTYKDVNDRYIFSISVSGDNLYLQTSEDSTIDIIELGQDLVS